MSINEIAKLAGVSYVTVSRALNHPDKVNAETRAKIQRIFAELNFKPRVIPNSLNTINLLVPSLEFTKTQDSIVLSTITSAIAARGFHTVISPVNVNPVHNLFHKAYISILHNGDIKALDFIKSNCSQNPLVIINDLAEDVASPAVLIGSDHRHGVKTAIDYLKSKGHSRIGYIGRSLTTRGFKDKYDSYEKIMKSTNIFDEDFVFLNSEKMLFEGIKRLCMKKITALFIAETELTLRSLYYLNLLGKKIPEDISVVATEFEGSTALLYPPITSVVQPLTKLSKTAVETIFKLMDKKEAIPDHMIYIPYSFIERESVIRI